MSLRPTKTPCTYCPYRRDVPSGVWHETEYEKLVEYDRETGYQPFKPFHCHQFDRDDERSRLCGGWLGCHGPEELLSVRLAISMGKIAEEDIEEVLDYTSPVPLFSSGAEAAEHGMAEIEDPGPEARLAIDKIAQMRSDLKE